MSEREALAFEMYPRGCMCGNNGGGCDWCLVVEGLWEVVDHE
jgi:hypothetical protein